MSNKLLNTYLGSKELKDIVIARSSELEIPFRYICHHLGLEYKDFMSGYINSTIGEAKITEKQFEGVLEMLGINLRFQFVVNKSFKASEMRCWLKEKYDTYIDQKNGKRQDTTQEEAPPAFD